METFKHTVAALALSICLFGLIIPRLISARSDILVAFGFLLIPVAIVALVNMYSSWSKTDEAEEIKEKLKCL